MRITVQGVSYSITGTFLEGDLNGYFILVGDDGTKYKVPGWMDGVTITVLSERMAA